MNRELKELIFVIPARSGSVRIPNKNFRKFGGRPLFEWSVQFAHDVSPLSHVYISTDNENLLNDSVEVKGASVISRSDQVSTAAASTEDWLREFIVRADATEATLAILQPTSPLRNSRTFTRAIQVFLSGSAKSVFATSDGRPNGSCYITEAKHILSGGSLTAGQDGQVGQVTSEWHWEKLDLDYEEDWILGENLLGQGICRDLHERVLTQRPASYGQART